MLISSPAPRPAQKGPPNAKRVLRIGEREVRVEVGQRRDDDRAGAQERDAPEHRRDRADRLDPPIEGEQHEPDDRQRDQVRLERCHPRGEEPEVLDDPDDARRHDQRNGEHRRPDEQERHEAAGAVLEALAEVEVRPARARHRRAELGPYEAVGEREQRAEDPPEHRLRAAERGDHQRDRHERPDPAHLGHVDRGRGAQPEAALEA
jgi:hypothetical protein